MRDILFILLGYLFGSVLFARVFCILFKKQDLTQNADDHNPGTANAYIYGGFACGTSTLICDILKRLYSRFFLYLSNPMGSLFPVCFGSACHGTRFFSAFNRFGGGKGIAVTFGCLLALIPCWQPVITLALFFIFYSVILKISPNFYRTVVTYVSVNIALPFILGDLQIILGFMLITVVVGIRMFKSSEQKNEFKVGLLWMH